MKVFKQARPNIIMEKKRIWHLMLVSYFVPFIGGLLVYLLKKNEDKNLANICFIGSLVNPMLIGFVIGFFEVFMAIVYDPVLVNIAGWVVLIAIGLAFNWAAIKRIYPDNQYRYFLPVFWFGLLGAVYSYYYAYKKDENLKNNVGWFFFSQLFLTIFLMVFSSVLLLDVFS